jgi:primosomal protein N'
MTKDKTPDPPEPCPRCEGPLVDPCEVGTEYICLNCACAIADYAIEKMRDKRGEKP